VQNVLTRFCVVAGYLGILGIIILSLMPGSSRPHTGWSGLVEHLIAYLLVAVVLGLGHRTPRARLIIGLLLTGEAALLELLQHFVAGRLSQFQTFAVGSVGAWIGLGLAASIIALGRLLPLLRNT
jgi:VanZ family protein